MFAPRQFMSSVYDRDAIVVDYFLGTASKFADAVILDAVQDVVSSDAPDPVALRQIDWELTPFTALIVT